VIHCEIAFVRFVCAMLHVCHLIVRSPSYDLSWNRLCAICVRKLFLNRNPAFIFRMTKATSVDKRLLVFFISVATFVWLLVIKPKSATLAFDRLVSEASFAFCSGAAFTYFRGASLDRSES
jgi:hypothetical protein